MPPLSCQVRSIKVPRLLEQINQAAIKPAPYEGCEFSLSYARLEEKDASETARPPLTLLEMRKRQVASRNHSGATPGSTSAGRRARCPAKGPGWAEWTTQGPGVLGLLAQPSQHRRAQSNYVHLL